VNNPLRILKVIPPEFGKIDTFYKKSIDCVKNDKEGLNEMMQ
jgi:hypothetical protein